MMQRGVVLVPKFSRIDICGDTRFTECIIEDLLEDWTSGRRSKMEIWPSIFPRCSKMLYCTLEGKVVETDVEGPTIFGLVHRIIIAHWLSRPLIFRIVIEDSAWDMHIIILP